jgi:uncharacterized protein (DUF433 family)
MEKIIISDPNVMNGTPVFRGTRVPAAVLFDNLAAGLTLETILAEWPTLNRQDVLEALHRAPESIAKAAA